MLLRNRRFDERLLVLCRVRSINFHLTPHLLSSFRWSFYIVTFRQINRSFNSVCLVLKLLVQVNVEVTAEVALVCWLLQLPYIIFLAHITLLLDVGFRIAELHRLGPLSPENCLRLWILLTSQRMIVILWQCVGQTLAGLPMVDDNGPVSLGSG